MPKSALRKKASRSALPEARKRRKPGAAANSMPLNFKVPVDFRREFKTYAAQQNKKLNQLLFDAFAALKERDAE